MGDMQWFPKLKKIEWFAIIGIILVYVGLTFSNLTKLPIFVDEALYLRWGQIAGDDATWRFISLTDGKQPLYTWVVIPFMNYFGDPLYGGRFTSALCGLFTLIGVMYGGWLLSGKKLAFWSGMVTMLSPFLFFYNRFAVMEGMLIMFGIWIFNLSILLARNRRLDIAMILGLWTGLALLVKSPAMFFMLLIPGAYLLTVDFKKIFTKELFQFGILVLIAWALAEIVNNIQLLSPWMYMIKEKNSFFIVPYDEIFKEPARLINNFLDIWRWHGAWTTIPVLIVAGFGLVSWLKQSWRSALITFGWFFLPVLGTILLARLFSTRYMVFTTPFLLLLAGYGLTSIENIKLRVLTFVAISIYPLMMISQLLNDPIHFHYLNVDEGYVNGWSAGNGTKQIAEWAVVRIKETGQPMTIYTEGTFGILPNGLELYAQGKTSKLTVTGLYPITDIPPAIVIEVAHNNPETYFILNNTITTDVPVGLELIQSYPKLRDNPMRLYRVIPR
jgi:4-amino-4-deoxy-L-arabinose transferase-like glycosyltransferase